MSSSGDAPRGDYAGLPIVSSDEEREALASSDRFVSELHRQGGVAPERCARYAWAASLAATKSVLDAACGVGWGTALLATEADRVTGIDISPPAVAAAERDYGDRAEFRVGDLQRLPFADGEFDLVVCFEALERVPDTEAVLAELRRVLAPSGLLLISAANRAVYPPGNPLHLHELTSDELRAAVGRHFANVAAHRQQTYLASLLADDATMAVGDWSRAIAADVAKIVATPPGGELYAVVAASDGELPAPPARLVLGGGVDHDEQRRLLASWQERAVAAEVEAAALRAEIEFVRRQHAG